MLRVTTISSRCGSMVHLETVHGRLTLDDTDVFLSESLESYLNGLGVDGLTSGMSAHGRRLSGKFDVSGFFDFLESYEWKCESIDKPGLAGVTNFAYKSFEDVQCKGNSCLSQMPGLELKAGVQQSSDDTGVVRGSIRSLCTATSL